MQHLQAQTSLIVGTLFQGTRLPLTLWFMAIYFISETKPGISALSLKQTPGVIPRPGASPQADASHDGTYTLTGHCRWMTPIRVVSAQVARRAGSENKVPFVAAVSLDTQTHPVYAQLQVVPGFTPTAMAGWARTDLHPLSDGLVCLNGVTAAGCLHETIIAGRQTQGLTEVTVDQYRTR